MTQKLFRLRPLTALIAALAAGSAFAQDTSAAAAPAADETQALGAVTVRSRNRIEKLQDVPLSISVVQGDELNRLNAYSIEELTKRAGNVQWNLGNQRTSSISIRGIGKVGQTEAQDPSVGVIVDGVSYGYNALTSSFDFVDIDTVEVSRGPQGTLLGKNTSVGNIIFNTKKASFTPGGDFQLSFNPQARGIQAWAAVTGPVIDNVLAWRGTFNVQRQEGDITNEFNKDITYTNKDRVSGRVQFLLTPSENLNATVRLELQPRAGETTNGRSYSFPSVIKNYANGAVYTPSTTTEDRLKRRWFSDIKSYTIDSYYNTLNNDAVRPLVTGSTGASAEVNWKVADHTLTSITAYKKYHFNAYNDDSTPFDISRNSGGYWNDYKQSSQELRLSSNVGGAVDYQAGVYLLRVRNSATYNAIYGNDYGAWNASNAQYTALDADGNGRYLLLSTAANLKTAKAGTSGIQDIDNKSAAIFGQANWRLSDALTVTTGARVTRENRNNIGESRIIDNGSASELNPSIVNNVVTGGFDSYWNSSSTATVYVRDGIVVANGTAGAVTLAPGAYALTTDTTDTARAATALAQANASALKYFGVTTWAALTNAQKKQLFYAQQIRKSAIGTLFQPTAAQPYKQTQPTVTISPSYKFGPDVTGYFSYQHGEKAGIAQNYNGVSYQVKPEKTDNFELGVKSALLKKTLVLNADVFLTNIKDYQTATQAVDVYATQQAQLADSAAAVQYASITGNVPKVQVYGLEVDGVYSGIPRTTLRFSGSYNIAKYKSFPQAAYAAERANESTTAQPYYDASGEQVPGTPKLTLNVGGDYRYPVFSDKELHLTFNVAYSDGSYNSNSLYTYANANVKVDLAAGLTKVGKTFDVSVLVKNAFNDKTPQSVSATSYSPAVPRSFVLQFTGKI